nr:MAG TPA: hypothetical protein [Caudoviricetes sp.]
MAEYIERGAALREAKYAAVRGLDPVAFVEDVPVADVAPVVRCKGCKHYDMGVCLKIYSDGNVHPEAWQPRRPDDFCSYGERKDGGNSDG